MTTLHRVAASWIATIHSGPILSSAWKLKNDTVPHLQSEVQVFYSSSLVWSLRVPQIFDRKTEGMGRRKWDQTERAHQSNLLKSLEGVSYFVWISVHSAQSNRGPLPNMRYCNPFVLSGRCAVVIWNFAGLLLSFTDDCRMASCCLRMWCTGVDLWRGGDDLWRDGKLVWLVEMCVGSIELYVCDWDGRPYDLHECSCSVYQSWLFSLHLYTVLIAVRMCMKRHTLVVCDCLSVKRAIWYEEKPHQCLIRPLYVWSCKQSYAQTREELRIPYSFLSFTVTGWLVIGWASVIHNLLFQVQSVQKPVPSSFYDLRAGNNGDVTVMFVVLIHVRKTFAILLWTFANGFKLDIDTTSVQMSMYLLMADYCNCHTPLDSAQAFEGHSHLFVSTWPWFASPFTGRGSDASSMMG